MENKQVLAQQFKHIHDKLEQHINGKLRDLDLTFSQLQVLVFLRDHEDEKVTQKDIGAYMRLKHSTVIGILQRMETKGLIVSSVDKDNRRCRNVTMTDKAREMDFEVYSHCRQIDDRLILYLNQDEQLQLRKLLNRVLMGLAEETKN